MKLVRLLRLVVAGCSTGLCYAVIAADMLGLISLVHWPALLPKTFSCAADNGR